MIGVLVVLDLVADAFGAAGVLGALTGFFIADTFTLGLIDANAAVVSEVFSTFVLLEADASIWVP